MLTSSKKAKGRKLQALVANKILQLFPELTKDDVKSTGSGQQGMDVQLSTKARTLFKFGTECKAQERFKSIYDVMDQAQENATDLEPLVVISMNRRSPLVILNLDLFFNLLKQNKESKHE